jgi:hypothetical protein
MAAIKSGGVGTASVVVVVRPAAVVVGGVVLRAGINICVTRPP